MWRNELRAEMARYGDTNETLAKALNISSEAFSKKINAKTDFKQTEIKTIMQRYNLSGEDLRRIFFATEVS